MKRSRVGTLSTNTLQPRNTSQFRSRKKSRRIYRRALYRSTEFKTHFRSVAATGAIINLPNNIVQSTVVFVNALPNAAGSEFWTTGGGVQPVDTGVSAPSFGQGDIVIRGGQSRITIANPHAPMETGEGNAAGDTLKVSVFAVWTNKRPDLTLLNIVVPQSWDPSVLPDFGTRVGKVLFRRDFFLGTEGKAQEVTYRYRPLKIDSGEFNNGGSQLYWLILIGQTTNFNVLAETCTTVTSHNISFSGDLV